MKNYQITKADLITFGTSIITIPLISTVSVIMNDVNVSYEKISDACVLLLAGQMLFVTTKPIVGVIVNLVKKNKLVNRI